MRHQLRLGQHPCTTSSMLSLHRLLVYYLFLWNLVVATRARPAVTVSTLWLPRGGGSKVDEDDECSVLPTVLETTTTTLLDPDLVHDQQRGLEASPQEKPAEKEEPTLEEPVGDVTPNKEQSTAPDETVQEKELEEHPEETQATNIDEAPIEDDETPESVLESSEDDQDQTDMSVARQQASLRRSQGKELHDAGDFVAAAVEFGAAADLLTNDEDMVEELATCRLHEALCRLKAEDSLGAVTACSTVLELDQVPALLRARAFHRRAKARRALGENDLALADARSAAFLGDRKAVALYGKLMRESSAGDDEGMPDLGASSALLESLLGQQQQPAASGTSNSKPPMPFLPTSLLDFGKASPFAAGGSAGGGGLAKSVLTSLSKKLDDEETQDRICGFLQSTSGPQLQQMASMAGLSLAPAQAIKIASFCQSITRKTLRTMVKLTKRLVYVVQLIRKVLLLMAKYRTLLILLCLAGWTKSAILRPIPLSKSAKRALRLASQTATGQA